MALKAGLPTLEGLDPAEQKNYRKGKYTSTKDGKPVEIDGFVLDVEDIDIHPAVGELSRAKAREKQRAQEAEDQLRLARTELKEAQEKEHERLRSSKPIAEVTALEESYQRKIKGHTDENTRLRTALEKRFVTDTALTLAKGIAVDDDAVPGLLPHIRGRLQLEVPEGGGDPRTRVLDSEGKPTALTVEDLRKELLETKSLARLVSGTKAAGSGAAGDGNRGGAPSQIDFNKSSAADIAAALEKADPSLATG